MKIRREKIDEFCIKNVLHFRIIRSYRNYQCKFRNIQRNRSIKNSKLQTMRKREIRKIFNKT